MKLVTREIGNSFILGVNSEIISEETVKNIDIQLNNIVADKKLALDLSCVTCICVEFLELLRKLSNERGISLINIQSEIFTLLNLTRHDGFVDIYLSEVDFVERRYPLINRRFSIV